MPRLVVPSLCLSAQPVLAAPRPAPGPPGCQARHRDAETGRFAERHVRIPR